MTKLPVARLYVDVVDSAIELFATISDDEWKLPAACTPGWTVRDLLSHMTGLADDITNGRIEGAGSEPWTAAQVERYRDDDPQMLIQRWKEQAASVGELVEAIGEQRPIFDCHSHEHDVRQAIGRPGNRESELIEVASTMMAKMLAKDAPATVKLATPDETLSFGDGPAVLDGLTRFELFRARLGRRSLAQMQAYNWSGPQDDIDATINSLFVFGPSPLDIDE